MLPLNDVCRWHKHLDVSSPDRQKTHIVERGLYTFKYDVCLGIAFRNIQMEGHELAADPVPHSISIVLYGVDL